MPKWPAQAIALSTTPGLDLLADRFHVYAGAARFPGVEIGEIDPPTTNSQTLSLLLDIEADSQSAALDLAYVLLDDVCRNAQEWISECGIAWLSDSEDGDDGVEIQDLFDVTVNEKESA